jgi:hypothetical protein
VERHELLQLLDDCNFTLATCTTPLPHVSTLVTCTTPLPHVSTLVTCTTPLPHVSRSRLQASRRHFFQLRTFADLVSFSLSTHLGRH